MSPAGKTLPHEKSRQKSSEKEEGEGEGEQHQWREMVTIRGALNSPSVPSTTQQPKAQAQLLPGAPASTPTERLFVTPQAPPLKFPNERNLVDGTIMK